MHIQSILRVGIYEALMIDTNMCLPWLEGSDHWCALCAVASCFTVLLRKQGIIQETFNFKVEGLVEDVGRHYVIWFMGYEDANSGCVLLMLENETLRRLQYLYLFQKEAYISNAAGRVMLRATSIVFGIVRVCSSVLWKIRE